MKMKMIPNPAERFHLVHLSFEKLLRSNTTVKFDKALLEFRWTNPLATTSRPNSNPAQNYFHFHPATSFFSETASHLLPPIRSCVSSCCVHAFVPGVVSWLAPSSQLSRRSEFAPSRIPTGHAGARGCQLARRSPPQLPQPLTHTHTHTHTHTILPLSHTQKLHWPLKTCSPPPPPQHTHLDMLTVGTRPSLAVSEL